jgi:hypothetical protein
LIAARVPRSDTTAIEDEIMLRHFASAGLVVLLLAEPAAAQDVRFNAQLRPRFERRDPAVPAAPVGDVVMRARLGVRVTLPDSLLLEIAVQDVLIWGATAATPGGVADPDVFVAFAEINRLFGTAGSLRAGRQEISLGNERLISRNNWGHRGQRFDGARLSWARSDNAADLFSVRLAESGASASLDAWLNGAHGAIALPGGDLLFLYTIHNRERGSRSTDQFTFGGHTMLDLAGTGWILEGYVQRGERADRTVSASQFSLGVARSVGSVRSQLTYERYSGDRDGDDRARAFDRLRGSNHAYHGYADLFTNIIANTGGRGLQDLSLRTTARLRPGTELQVNGHIFRAVEARGEVPFRFGEEVDLVIRHRPRAHLVLEAGISRVVTGPALRSVRDLESGLTFGYVMTTLAF